jgi:hypothetical protein
MTHGLTVQKLARNSNMSQNKLLLPILGAAVIAGGGAAAYYFVNQSSPTNTTGTSGQPSLPAAPIPAASVVPPNALVVATINTDGAALKQLELLVSPELKKLFDTPIQEFNRSLTSQDIDFAKDIQAWAGGQVIFAVLPASAPSASQPRLYSPVSFKDGTNNRTILAQVEAPTTPAKTPNFVIVAEVKDKDGATKFLDKSRTKANAKTKTQDYKGVTITVPETPNPNGLVSAFVKDYLVMSNSEASVQAAIDSANGGSSIASELLTAGLGVENPFMGFYIPNIDKNVDQLVAFIEQASADSPLPPNFANQLKRYASIGVVGGVDSQGIRVKMAVKTTVDFLSASSPSQIMSLLPSDTIGLVSGINIKGSWEQSVKLAESDPEMKQAVELIRTSAKGDPFNIDIDKEVFGWMDGEHAIALIPSTEGVLAQSGLGPVLLIQTSDRPSAEALLKKLDEVAQKNATQVKTREVGGIQVTDYSDPSGAIVFMSHGWVQPNTLFVSAAPLVAAFAPKPASSLAEDATYKATISKLLGSSQGYFYLDMSKLVAIIKKQVPAGVLEKESEVFLDAVQVIAVSYVTPDARTANLDFLAVLKKPAN